MKTARILSLGLLVLTASMTASLQTGCAGEGDGSGEDDLTAKPVQFVLFAFDGSKNNAFWQESRDFAKTVKKGDGKPALKFSYFVNPSYYLSDAKKSAYCGPRVSCGQSAIGFGGTDADIAERIRQTAAAFAEGHAIESHAVGHYDGTAWSEAEWTKEFDAFNKLFFTNPDGSERAALNPIKVAGIIGFRAPQLGQGPGLYATLKAKGFRYDTSKINSTNYWPEKLGGVWNFPLASLVLKNSGKRTLSMDYNHYMAHSKAQPDGGNAEKYRADVVQTYMQYFNANYAGNRAPIHIGHHFSKWNGGAYWSAMKDFAVAVCSKPDVVCGTYRDLVTYMEALPAGKRAKLQAGNFEDSASACPATEAACQGESASSHDDEE
jgi:hypothetical protein